MLYKNVFVRKRRVLKGFATGMMAIVIAASSICMPENIQMVYAEETGEAEEEISAGVEIRSINLNIDGKIAGICNPTPAKTQDAEWSNGSGSYIKFGYFNSNEVKYRVLDSDTTDFSIDGTHTILLDCNTVLNTRMFDNDAKNGDNGQSKPNDWKYSDMYLYLNTETGVEEPFTQCLYGYSMACGGIYERGIITESYNTSHSSWNDYVGDSYSELTGEKIFLLDSREVKHGAYGYYEGAEASNSMKKSSSKSWALRSSPAVPDKAEIVTKTGNIDSQYVTYQSFGVSPAFNIDKSKIFFVRAASADYNYDRFGATVVKTSAETWNLTLFDGSSVFECERTDRDSVEYGDTIGINITAIGDFIDGEYRCPGTGICYDQISALIEDGSGTVVYYGKVANPICDKIKILVPEGLEDGSYTLKIFAEDVNYSSMSSTHFASNVIDFPIQIATKEETDIVFNNYNPSASYSGNALENPTESQLTIKGANYEDVDFTWYKDNVSDENKLESAPSKVGTYYLVASVVATEASRASSVTSEAIIISPKSVTPYISGSISKVYDGTDSVENVDNSLSIELNGVITGDRVSANGYTFHYDNFEIGERKTIMAEGITLAGEDKDNYILSSPSVAAEVGVIGKKKKPLNIPEHEIYVANTVKIVADSMVLPDGWEWNGEDADKTIGAGNTVTANAVYMAEDSIYYETTSVEISITRAECEKNTDIVVEQEPTCTEKGSGHIVCSLCGDTLCELMEIPELGHDWDSGTVTKASNCMENGIMTYSCVNCGHAKTESIEKTAHVAANMIVENQVQPDCTKMGSYDETVYCSMCKTELNRKQIIVSATGHLLSKVEAKEPTVSESGNAEYWKCGVCNKLFSDEKGENETILETITIPAKEENSSNIENTDNGNTNGESNGGSQGGTIILPETSDKDSQKEPEENEMDAGISNNGDNSGSQYIDKDNDTISDKKPDAIKVTTAPVGTILKDVRTNGRYVVTSRKNKTVKYLGLIKKNVKTASISSKVKIGGVTYKVTSVAANALKNNRKVKKVTIGRNIKKIGKRAFYGCKNLKSITIKSTMLRAKTVGNKVFWGINNKAVIKVPKEKLKAYKKLLKSCGFKGKVYGSVK